MLFVAHKMNDVEFQADQMSLSVLNAGSRGPDLAYHYYFTDQTNVIRQNSTQQAASSDSPLGG